MGVKDTANLAMIPAAYAEDKVYSVLPSDGDGDFTFTRSGSGTRINKGGYIETMGNNVPRLNYRLDADGNPTECAELLLEESRRNLFLNSEDFTNGSWIKTRTTITGNQSIAPDGTNNADLLTGDGTGTSYVYDGVFLYSATYYISIFVKNINGNDFTIQNFTQSGTVVFDLVNKSITSTSGTISDAKIEQYQNNWFRVSAKITSTLGGANCNLGFGVKNYNGEQFYIWGAQVEDNASGGGVSNVSSYIPTSFSSVTRNVDSAYNQPFGDLTSDYPITLYWKGRITAYDSGGFNTQSFAGIAKNNDAVRYLNLKFYSTTQLQLERRNTTQRQNFITYTTQLDDVKKIAIKYISSTHVVIFIDGIEVFNNSSLDAVSWDFDSTYIGQFRYNADTGKRIPADELFVWNKALTDAEMVDVTSYDTFAEMATGQQYTIQ
jgi:hypothetical protein